MIVKLEMKVFRILNLEFYGRNKLRKKIFMKLEIRKFYLIFDR